LAGRSILRGLLFVCLCLLASIALRRVRCGGGDIFANRRGGSNATSSGVASFRSSLFAENASCGGCDQGHSLSSNAPPFPTRHGQTCSPSRPSRPRISSPTQPQTNPRNKTGLRDVAAKADRDKREAAATEAALGRADAGAAAQYARDRAAAAAVAGRWEWDASCGYYYSERHRWYYDPKSGSYYGGGGAGGGGGGGGGGAAAGAGAGGQGGGGGGGGGGAPEWTSSPPIPSAARFGVAPHTGGPVPQPATAGGGGGAAGSASASAPAATAAAAAAAANAANGRVSIVLKAAPAHPLAAVGGYQMPSVGRIGGAKGLGTVGAVTEEEGAATAPNGGGGGGGGSGAGGKRKAAAAAGGARGAGAGGSKGGGDNKARRKEAPPEDPAEAAARARREAARARVQARTMAAFGLE